MSGRVELGGSAIEFASGQITTIAAGASLTLLGGGFIEDSTALGSNSALTGLSDIAGNLSLGSSVSTTGALVNSGRVDMGGTGTTLSIAGALTNTGRLDIGGGSSVTAKSVVNSGTIDLTGRETLNVSGATTNNGSISINDATEEFAGAVGEAVGKTGSFSLYFSNNLQFDSSVSSGQTINKYGPYRRGTDNLTLEQAQSFAATISGFGRGDTIDATNFGARPQRRTISSRILRARAARSR